ncbi:MAG: DUF488 domain-containing protein [Chloroflexi bacterium]|nr:DUF488 domain-containing protein [Chloroflexota bacterium]MCI0645590.1 DUF488 domain-containing protein [Chloroflexota bacterium]MCI0730442.1 DUF488 domain-containing protein [Chloroflexota bacterium]
MTVKVITIGVYGYREEAFFQALQEAGVDTFCDIRRRRGVRGSEYAFANSQRLQKRLAELGIRYLHRLDLAPTTAIRQRQAEADKAGKVARRKRAALDPVFVNAYREQILAHFEPQSLVDELGPAVRVVALFCVEREPAACHRSLVAEKLQQELGWQVEHIVP